MNFFDLFFGTGNAIRVIFKLGYMPKEDEFYELTCQQYQHFFEMFGQTEEKIFMLLPSDRQKYKAFASDDVFCITESEKASLKDGEAIIEKYCEDSGKQFSSFHEKLCYVASHLPPVFSKDTPYSRESEKEE